MAPIEMFERLGKQPDRIHRQPFDVPITRRHPHAAKRLAVAVAGLGLLIAACSTEDEVLLEVTTPRPARVVHRTGSAFDFKCVGAGHAGGICWPGSKDIDRTFLEIDGEEQRSLVSTRTHILEWNEAGTRLHYAAPRDDGLVLHRVMYELGSSWLDLDLPSVTNPHAAQWTSFEEVLPLHEVVQRSSDGPAKRWLERGIADDIVRHVLDGHGTVAAVQTLTTLCETGANETRAQRSMAEGLDQVDASVVLGFDAWLATRPFERARDLLECRPFVETPPHEIPREQLEAFLDEATIEDHDQPLIRWTIARLLEGDATRTVVETWCAARAEAGDFDDLRRSEVATTATTCLGSVGSSKPQVLGRIAAHCNPAWARYAATDRGRPRGHFALFDALRNMGDEDVDRRLDRVRYAVVGDSKSCHEINARVSACELDAAENAGDFEGCHYEIDDAAKRITTVAKPAPQENEVPADREPVAPSEATGAELRADETNAPDVLPPG